MKEKKNHRRLAKIASLLNQKIFNHLIVNDETIKAGMKEDFHSIQDNFSHYYKNIARYLNMCSNQINDSGKVLQFKSLPEISFKSKERIIQKHIKNIKQIFSIEIQDNISYMNSQLAILSSIIERKFETSKEHVQRQNNGALEIYEELLALSNEYGEDFKIDAQDIIIVTKEVTLEDTNEQMHEFGRFRIAIHYRGDSRGRYHIEAEDDSHHHKNDHRLIHPHVMGNYLCEGEASESISFAFAERRISDVVCLITSVLNTYNPEGPYKPLETWSSGEECASCNCSIADDSEVFHCELCNSRGAEPLCTDCICYCDNCSTYICDDHQGRCNSCRDYMCTDCLSTCANCGESVCSSCAKKCTECGQKMCEDCVSSCQECGELICNDCGINCKDCGELFCKDHAHKCDDCGKFVCGACSLECNECDVHMCKRCNSPCPDCDQPMCSEHSYKCYCCEDLKCNDCINKCNKCSNQVCLECTITCEGCGSEICSDCYNEEEKICCVCKDKERKNEDSASIA